MLLFLPVPCQKAKFFPLGGKKYGKYFFFGFMNEKNAVCMNFSKNIFICKNEVS